ncbi:hypothetical protein BC827DRAFT_1386984 [Russula dissimulans]|nr:hypothetical protein BC827DRAFT_1386984 [Russula dissimulans]
MPPAPILLTESPDFLHPNSFIPGCNFCNQRAFSSCSIQYPKTLAPTVHIPHALSRLHSRLRNLDLDANAEGLASGLPSPWCQFSHNYCSLATPDPHAQCVALGMYDMGFKFHVAPFWTMLDAMNEVLLMGNAAGSSTRCIRGECVIWTGLRGRDQEDLQPFPSNSWLKSTISRSDEAKLGKIGSPTADVSSIRFPGHVPSARLLTYLHVDPTASSKLLSYGAKGVIQSSGLCAGNAPVELGTWVFVRAVGVGCGKLRTVEEAEARRWDGTPKAPHPVRSAQLTGVPPIGAYEGGVSIGACMMQTSLCSGWGSGARAKAEGGCTRWIDPGSRRLLESRQCEVVIEDSEVLWRTFDKVECFTKGGYITPSCRTVDRYFVPTKTNPEYQVMTGYLSDYMRLPMLRMSRGKPETNRTYSERHCTTTPSPLELFKSMRVPGFDRSECVIGHQMWRFSGFDK